MSSAQIMSGLVRSMLRFSVFIKFLCWGLHYFANPKIKTWPNSMEFCCPCNTSLIRVCVCMLCVCVCVCVCVVCVCVFLCVCVQDEQEGAAHRSAQPLCEVLQGHSQWHGLSGQEVLHPQRLGRQEHPPQ